MFFIRRVELFLSINIFLTETLEELTFFPKNGVYVKYVGMQGEMREESFCMGHTILGIH